MQPFALPGLPSGPPPRSHPPALAAAAALTKPLKTKEQAALEFKEMLADKGVSMHNLGAAGLLSCLKSLQNGSGDKYEMDHMLLSINLTTYVLAVKCMHMGME